jgi:protein-tyrosine phosphatase
MKMDLVPINAERTLFLSPDVEDWAFIRAEGISVVIDVDAGLDTGLPTTPGEFLYVYFPFNDDGLPDLKRLHAVARLGADLLRRGYKILVHCALGYNRSALVCGVILRQLGVGGVEALKQVRDCRPGALYNKVYAEYLAAGAVEE